MNNIVIPKNSSITKTLYYVNTSKNNIINGIITIDDSGIQYDNKLYFAYSIKEKIPVLSIYEDSLYNYIYNIFSDSLFDFQKQNINHIEYNNIKNYNLIVLDQLTEIPHTLKEVLKTHLKGRQNIFVFLKQKINQRTYNTFFKSVNGDIINDWDNTKKQVEYINYVHPIFKSVFQQQKQNFRKHFQN